MLPLLLSSCGLFMLYKTTTTQSCALQRNDLARRYLKLDDGYMMLDVGVGTGGALCTVLIDRVQQFKSCWDWYWCCVCQHWENIHLGFTFIWDVHNGKQKILNLAMKLGATLVSDGHFVDTVYFSAFFSLLSNPVKAMQLLSAFVKENCAKVYITKIYAPFFLPYLNPLLKYATNNK